MTLCDAGDVFTIPANLEKSFDQISRAVSHVFSSGSLPIMIGGDHSIGFSSVSFSPPNHALNILFSGFISTRPYIFLYALTKLDDRKSVQDN